MNILVTGANGFVGAELIPQLQAAGHTVTALVRSGAQTKKQKNVTWIVGDLLDPKSLPELEHIDRAYYLVHGMKSDHKTFEYVEAMAAVNFVNWIRPTGAGIIYLGGLFPDWEKLSPHMRSRKLTGAIMGSSGLALIEFRASIILGQGSLSFELIKALSERLPFRPDMSQLDRPAQPLALQDLMKYLLAALEQPKRGQKIYEIGGPDVTSYGELLDLYAELAGLRRLKLKVPDVESNVILKALEYAVPEHADIGKKLAESLKYPSVMTNKDALSVFSDIKPLELRVAMDLARSESRTKYPALWNKEFLRTLLSDKILTQSGLLSPDILKNLERVGKLKEVFSRNK
jgi:uncharacterized protein YbjT (DUF2867 family)